VDNYFYVRSFSLCFVGARYIVSLRLFVYSLWQYQVKVQIVWFTNVLIMRSRFRIQLGTWQIEFSQLNDHLSK